MNQLKVLVSGLAFAGLVGAGCTSQPASKPADTTAIRSDVSDIRPMEATGSTYQPVQPVTYDAIPAAAPIAATTATPSRSTFASSGSTHIVKRGETFYSIARQSYGDGKQWQKIAMANPGVTPSALKVGQAIIVP